MNKIEESKTVEENLPLIKMLLSSKKIDRKEKLRVFEDTKIDLREYLERIGELQ